MRGTIDRIEGSLAVCQMDDKTMKEIALESFPENPKEGMMFLKEANGIRMLPEETAQKEEKVKALFQKLKKK